MIEPLRTTSSYLFEQDWARAFRGCGFGSEQTGLTKHLKSRFPAIIPEGGVPAELLTLTQLQCVWPGRKEIPIGWLFLGALARMCRHCHL